MTPPTPRRLVLELPPMTSAQAGAVFEVLGEFMDALWQAYQPELLDAAVDHATRVHDEAIADEQLDRSFCEPVPTPERA